MIRSIKTARWVRRAGMVPGLSRALRWYAHRYREDSVVTIRHGHAAGFLWRRHHRYVNGFWLGHYELAIQEALHRHLRAGQTFYDIGANAGFFTLLGARCVGPQGRCVAFDPLPENYECIVDQIGLNRLVNCRALPLAVGETERPVTLSFASPGSSMAHVGRPRAGEQCIEAPMVSLDWACSKFGRPDFMKVDIEGAEAAALRGAGRLLREVKPGWLIELHGPECERSVKATLLRAGYSFFWLDGSRVDPDAMLPRHFVALHGARS